MYPSNTSYGPVQPTAESSLQLRSSVHSLHELRKAGYILSQLPAAELERKKRCNRCSKVLKKERRKKPHAKPRLPLAPVVGAAPSPALSLQDNASAANKDAAAREAVGRAQSGKGDAATEKPEETTLICKFHSGRISNRTWTCCNKPPRSQPCSGRDQHVPHQYGTGELERNWRFYETAYPPLTSHVSAVVIDCEMGTASSGETELIRISVVDYFTGAVLLDKLVYPSVPMAHYNTRFSGVTRSAMEEARRKNKCILGRDAARNAVFKFVGPRTVVVGHGANGDLSCLRWIHRVIIDTLLIETKRRQVELVSSSALSNALEDLRSADDQEMGSNANDGTEVEGNNSSALQKEGGLSLKALTLKRLDRVIQVKGRGHDSLEDARATRDLLHWYMANALDTEGMK